MKKPSRRMGRPLKEAAPGERISLGLKVTAEMKRKIDQAAQKNGRTQSQEAEFRLRRDFNWEATKQKIDALLDEAKEALSASKIQAIRKAGFEIVRDHGGGKATVNVSPELLLAEADGILRSGFVAAEDVYKSPTEIMVERAVLRALEKHAQGGTE